MALPNKISSVVFTILNGASTVATHTLSVTNLQHPFEMVFWGSPSSLSLGGTKRSNVRGFDARLEFEWNDIRNQESEIVAFLNDIQTNLLLGYRLRFNVEGDTDYLFVIPNSALYNQNYISQIKRSPTSISFELEALQNDISYE